MSPNKQETTKQPTNQRTNEPPNHRTTEPPNQRTTEPTNLVYDGHDGTPLFGEVFQQLNQPLGLQVGPEYSHVCQFRRIVMSTNSLPASIISDRQIYYFIIEKLNQCDKM